eukprot:scaffold63451_cov63-Phaeocystis_antarctica.AAC.6
MVNELLLRHLRARGYKIKPRTSAHLAVLRRLACGPLQSKSPTSSKARSGANNSRPLWQPGAVLCSGRVQTREASGSRGTRENRGPELDKSAAKARGSTYVRVGSGSGSGPGLGLGVAMRGEAPAAACSQQPAQAPPAAPRSGLGEAAGAADLYY